MDPVKFFFDFGSPNAYLSHKVIPGIEARTGARFDYVPVLLGGIFKLTGNQSPATAFAGIKNKPAYDTFEQLYAANWGSTAVLNDNGQAFTHPQNVKFIDLPCGSQAQADFLSHANRVDWPMGRMAGYANSTIGYPANMQPALAVAATSGIPNAAQAWITFQSRASKPDYSTAPQWAIVPR